MHRQGIGVWVIVVVAVCAAALGAWAGSNLGDGRPGNVALIGATCGVLGSFLPGSVAWVLGRVRHLGGRGNGAL